MIKTPSLPGHIRDFVLKWILSDDTIQHYAKQQNIFVKPLQIDKSKNCISSIIARDNGRLKLPSPTLYVGFEPYIVGSHLDPERNGFSIQSARGSAGGIPLGFGYDPIEGITSRTQLLDRNILITTCDKQEHCHYLPFISTHPSIIDSTENIKKHSNINRRFKVGYMNRVKCNRREQMFNNLVYRFGVNQCHALGERCGTYPETLQPSNNPRSGQDCWYNDKLHQLYSNYTFMIAMENTISPGYITEKILNSFIAGAIPIYYGTDEIKDVFNTKAFIHVTDYKSIEDCAEYISSMNNKEILQMQSQHIFKKPLHGMFKETSEMYSNIRNDIISMCNHERP